MTALAAKQTSSYAPQSVYTQPESDAQHSELHQAALDNGVVMIRKLISSGTNPNTKNANGSTPLHFAAARNNIEAVKTLLALGADPLITNKAGLSAVEIGLFMGNISRWYEG